MIPIDWDFSKPGAFTVVHHFLICGRGLLHFYLGHFQVACVSKDFVGLCDTEELMVLWGGWVMFLRLIDITYIIFHYIRLLNINECTMPNFITWGGCLKWGLPPSWRSWCLDVGLSAYLGAKSRQQQGSHYSDHKTWGHMGTVFLFLKLEILAQLDI